MVMVADTGRKVVERKSETKVVEYTLDDDISQLVPPTFSTVSKGPPQPMLELKWDHQYTPIGEKLASPNIHMCVDCKLPIRIYGRLIPCKHVYCHSCATKLNYCSSCTDRVTRIEQAHLGQVFMCHYGGNRYGLEGCRRTYLSQRDLQAHIDHRHRPRGSSGMIGSSQDISSSRMSSVATSTTTSSSYSSSFDHGGRDGYGGGGRQNIPVHYSSSGSGVSSSRSVSGSGRSGTDQGQGQGGNNNPGSRYERKPSFNRNQSWSSYNNRH